MVRKDHCTPKSSAVAPRPELGSHLDLTTAQQLTANGPGAAHGALDAPAIDAGTITTGWAVINGTQPDCVLIADQAGTDGDSTDSIVSDGADEIEAAPTASEAAEPGTIEN